MIATWRTRRPSGGFRRNAVSAAVQAMDTALDGAAAGPSRRRFLQTGAAGAMAVGLPILSACGGGGDDVRPAAPPLTGAAPPTGAAGERMTLFFDYSHLDTTGKSMWVQVGTDNFRLRPIADAPDVLARERSTNRFLAAVDDRHITHVVEDVPAPPPEYVGFQVGRTFLDNGDWTMDTVGILLPESAAVVGFEHARTRLGGAGGALPVSAKRRKYGLPAATSARDVHEEQALQGTVSHAATLMTMHKDMMALDSGAASTVVNSYVLNSISVDDVDDKLSLLGAAGKELQPGVLNQNGWATLRPMKDPSGKIRRIDQPNDPLDGRIVYMPVFHKDLAPLVAAGVLEVLPQIQDDPTLGADVTTTPAPRGTLWARRDAKTTVLPSAKSTQAAGDAVCAIAWPQGQNHWLDCSASTTESNGVRQVGVSFSNTGLRYLSSFVELYDESDNLITLGTLPDWSAGTWITQPKNFDYDPSDNAGNTRIYVGAIASLGTIMGIPVFTDSDFFGSLEVSLKLSSRVRKIRFLSGGLGTGSNNYPETIAGGVAATMIMNYVVTILFGVAGAIPELDVALSLLAGVSSAVISALAAGITDSFSGNDWLTPQFWIDQGLNLLNLLVNIVGTAIGPGLQVLADFGKSLATLLAGAVAESALEKAIPIVGIILNVESALAAAVDFALTTVAIAQSPFTYVTDVTLTHDLAVTVNQDPGNTSFPKSANVMTVIAAFKGSPPHRQDIALSGDYYPNSVPPVVFAGVPYGGNVQIDVQFNLRPLDGSSAQNILLGAGTTGLVDNGDEGTYSITIKENPYPVGPDTVYVHNQRSYLDAGGQHVWVREGAPANPVANCGDEGDICQYNSLAVRQGTRTTATTLGYAWRAQTGGRDVGYQAVLNADHPSAGYAVAGNPRGTAGLDIAMSRHAGGSDNFYVDPTGSFPMIRGIQLDGSGGPGFDGPSSNRAYGRLTYPSDALLQHPSGFLISVSASTDRFEVLTPPSTAVTDAVASTTLIASVCGTKGSQPSRIEGLVAATVTQDGVLLLLENGNNRIQAFDFGSQPARYFTNAPTPYFLPLDELPQAAGWSHIDIEADLTGLIYLLSKNDNGVHRLSIYDRLSKLQKAISVTEGLYAARIGLDHFRYLYTLNNQPITVQNSNRPPATPEPSVSLWIPQQR